ncbi:MAG: endonuclease III [Sulfurimonas sp. RIFOXYB2_FULL_37_5]|nr:MAG: endonuclease III [Sulfurimonas sp. RIFOXYB2_FULL_37_5]
MTNRIRQIYDQLYDRYGPQGWWPLLCHSGTNTTKTGCIKGYHPKEYSFPRSADEIFEICCGAILTQNTSWVAVEKALLNLNRLDALSPRNLLDLDDQTFKEAIKPAGYFNQKAKKLRIFTSFFLVLNGRIPNRDELLGIWGIGPETADSILLYAYKVPTFVVDAYTRRIFSALGIISEQAEYAAIKKKFEENIPSDYIIYQEYHALIVEHAKRYYAKKGLYQECPLMKKYRI